MKKTSLLLLGTALFFSVSMSLHAQTPINGCINSPENPTAILALLGSAGAFLSMRRKR